MADSSDARQVPIGFAHRGGRATARENTLSAFRAALAAGATGLETDAWVTADGIAVLDHDGVVRRGLRKVPIARLPRAELPSHIPALQDLYRSCGADYELSVDVKDAQALDAVIHAAHEERALHRLWLCHPDGQQLRRWRERAGAAHLVLSTELGRIPEGLASRAKAAAADGLAAINLRARQWSEDDVRAVHEAGLSAFGWDVQTVEALRRACSLGLDAIYSDHVARMVAVLRRNAAG